MEKFSSRYLRFNNKKNYKSLPILWPVHVYRVIYPDFKDKGLNLFQEGILGLIRAGCKTPAEISKLLDLNKDLVLFIIRTQLQPNGWIDKKRKITEKGQDELNGEVSQKGSLYKQEEPPEKNNQKIGYVFWDIISQSWMPRFVTKLDEIEAQEYKNGFPTFIEELAKGKPLTPYRLKALYTEKPDFHPNDILEAYRAYRLDIHHARQLKTQEKIPREQEVRLANIEFISNEPEKMYLWTTLFYDQKSDELWSIRDPFGIRSSVPWLRQSLLSIINNEIGLAKQIGQLIGTPRAKKQTAQDWLKSIDQYIKIEILTEYPYLEEHTDISRYLLAVKRREQQIQGGLDQSENLESLLTDAQKLIESVLKWLLSKWTVDLQRLPSGRQRISKEQLIGIYQSLDLKDLSPEIIEQLSRQNWGNINSSLRWKNESRASLKALLCGVVLSVSENSNHPFKKIPIKQLNLGTILELADLRNKAGHASGHHFDKIEVLNLCDSSIKWTETFKEWL